MNTEFEQYLSTVGEVGFVTRVISSIAYADGLPGVKPSEMVLFESGEWGEVQVLNEHNVEILIFSPTPIRVGTRVARTGTPMQIPLGPGLEGMIIDPLGNAIQPYERPSGLTETRPIDITPLGIGSRAKINRPCSTGVTIVDFMVPLGKGQRELVIGDQKSGKTYFLLRALLAQIREGAIGIYAAIGKSKTVVKQVAEFLAKTDAMKNSIIVASYAEDSPSIISRTPYAAMTIAEYFRDNGRDVLLVLDDLSTHAKMYRELMLLASRLPGRNSYPSDIFYTHSRLLERAGNFVVGNTEHSITCLPVVEAAQGDISGYIQTNLISITDGHIFFDYNLFIEGRRPAVNPFLSVTRVGKQAQSGIKKEINELLIQFLSSSEKLHAIASFGTELTDQVRKTLVKEERIITLFDQMAYEVVPEDLQLFLFGMLWTGYWDTKPRDTMQTEVHRIISLYTDLEHFRSSIQKIVQGIDTLDKLLAAIEQTNIDEIIGEK
jgi:F-type H+/Na+-transporting ATPase subunit alpha